MTQINDEFHEIYKQVDKICREMFGADKGVSQYLTEMETIKDGKKYVSSWNIVYDKDLC